MRIFTFCLLAVFCLVSVKSNAQFHVGTHHGFTFGIGYVTPKFNNKLSPLQTIGSGLFDNTSNMGGYKPQIGYTRIFRIKEKRTYHLHGGLARFNEYQWKDTQWTTVDSKNAKYSYQQFQQLNLKYSMFFLDHMFFFNTFETEKKRFGFGLGIGTRYMFRVIHDSSVLNRETYDDNIIYERRTDFSRKLKPTEKYYLHNYVDLPILGGLYWEGNKLGAKLTAGYSMNNHLKLRSYDNFKAEATQKKFFVVDFNMVYFIRKKDPAATQDGGHNWRY